MAINSISLQRFGEKEERMNLKRRKIPHIHLCSLLVQCVELTTLSMIGKPSVTELHPYFKISLVNQKCSHCVQVKKTA